MTSDQLFYVVGCTALGIFLILFGIIQMPWHGKKKTKRDKSPSSPDDNASNVAPPMPQIHMEAPKVRALRQATMQSLALDIDAMNTFTSLNEAARRHRNYRYRP